MIETEQRKTIRETPLCKNINLISWQMDGVECESFRKSKIRRNWFKSVGGSSFVIFTQWANTCEK